jgi:alkylation response protein AidB-like acyl-CoA dehydrogenase
LAQRTGQSGDAHVRQLVAEDRINERVQGQLVDRVATGIRTGALPGPAGAIPRLFQGTNNERRLDIALEIVGTEVGAWVDDGSPGFGDVYLVRQGGSLGGGSNEMARNIISERVLGMPREYSADRDKPFDEVRHN